MPDETNSPDSGSCPASGPGTDGETHRFESANSELDGGGEAKFAENLTDPDYDDADGNTDDDSSDRSVSAASPTRLAKLSASFLKPKQIAPEQPKAIARTNAEKRAMMIQLDPLERKIVVIGSLVAAALTAYFTIPYMISKIAVVDPGLKPNKHHVCPSPATFAKGGTCNVVYPVSHYVFLLAVWGAFALGLFVTSRIGRRVPAAFVAVMIGLAFGTPVTLIPFALVGGWLFVRAWRVQKWGSPTAKGPINDEQGKEVLGAGALRTATTVEPRGRSRTRSSGSGSSASLKGGAAPASARHAPSATGRSRRSKKDPVPKGPAPNKRYTPKAPTRRRPQPKPASSD